MIGSKKLMHFLGCFVSIFVIAFFMGLFFDINPISAGDESYIKLDVGTPGVGPVGWVQFKREDLEGNSGFVMSDGNGIIQIPVDVWENRFDLNEGDIGRRFYVSQNCTNFRHSELECDTANVIIDIVADSLGKPVTSMRYEDSSPVQFFAGDSQYIFNDNLKSVPKHIQLYVGLYNQKSYYYGPFSGGYVVGEDEIGNVGGYSSNAEGLVKIPVDFIGERYELTGSDIGKIFYVSQDCDNFAYNQYDDTLDVDESFVCDDALVKIKIEDNNSGDIVVLKYKKEYGEWNLFENDSGYIFMNIIDDTAGFIKMDVGVPGLGAFNGGPFVYEDLEGNSGFVMSDENGIIQIPVDYTSGGMIYRDELNESDIGKTFYIHQDCDDFDYDNLICDTSVVRIDIVSNTAGDPVASYHYVSGKLSGDLVKFSALDSKYIFNNEVCGSAEIKAKLTSENNVLQTGIFEFVLKEDGTTIATARNNTNGNIIFEKMKYTIPGTYIYTISQNGCPVGYVCDSGEIEVQVNVVDNGDGTFATSTMYSRGGTNSPDYNEFPFQNTPVYTATFEANGADSIGADVITGVTITLPSITRLGYVALGWSTDSGATVAEYAVRESITLTGDVVLYAITRPATATFLPGSQVNTALKSLATGVTVISYETIDTLIQQIVRTGGLVQGFTTGLLSTSDSEVPIIAWYDNGILYYYTEADVIYLNQNSSYMFRNVKSGTYIDTSGWDTSKVTNMYSMFYFCNSLIELDVSNWNISSVKNMSWMFNGCRNLAGLDVSDWDTSNVTNMSYMFSSCRSLTGLDVSDWDTSSVTTMGRMFNQCMSLTELDVSSWDTSNVTTMESMFDSCYNLAGIDVSGWDTSKVTNMYGMFNYCRNLTSLDLSNFDTSNVTDMHRMFANCSSLTGLDVRGWDTSRVTDMKVMFGACISLETIYASTGFIISGVTNSDSMFSSTNKLVGGHGTKSPSIGITKSGAVIDSTTASGYLTYDIAVSYRTRSGVELARQVIDVGDTTVASSITGYNVLGYYTNTGLTTPFDFSQELRKYTEVYVDYECATGYKLEDGLCRKILTATFLPGTTFNRTIKSLATGATVTSYDNVDTLIQQVVRTGNIPTGVTTGLLSTNTSEVPVVGWFDDGILYYYTEAEVLYLNQNSNEMFNKIQSGTYIDTSGWDTSRVIIMGRMFYECSSLTGLDVSEWDTSSVTNMGDMFRECSSLTGLDVSEWNTSKVTSMGQMFRECSSLTSLDTSGWNTSSVTDMNSMFTNCSNLTELDVSNWDTSNVISMSQMFLNCSSLTSLDVGGWDTSKVTSMYYMFGNCSGLTSLDVGGWDTSKVTSMGDMFYNCSSLTGLDVSEWNTSSGTDMSYMFYKCSGLMKLDVSHFDTSNVTNMSQMFNGCSSLTGLDVSEWNTSNVTNMYGTFAGCSSLTSLDVSEWNTSKVINMRGMFSSCSSLTELDVSNFDTSKVTNMRNMFARCSSLTELDVSNFDTSKVTNMQQMFQNSSNLKTIYASTGFITSGVTNSTNMFGGTSKLIGGHGTKYSSSYTDKTLAVLDSETESGYLTYDIAVSYRTRSGAELTRQIINVGDTTVAPTIIRTGYAVSGWYTDTGLTTLFDFSQNLRKYTELYVMWKCDTGYMLSGDGVTCIPLTYTVRHFIKNAGVLSYTLSGTEVYTGIAGERVNLSDFSRRYPSCIVYSRGSLTGDESGPGVVVTGANIAGDGTTVLNLYYDRNIYTVELDKDLFTSVVEGAGSYECGQEVQIRAYPIEGYHFDVWEEIGTGSTI